MRLTLLCLAVGLALALGMAQEPTPDIRTPDTPAGRTFKALLDAFNSGDHAQIETYCRTFGNP
jgi:hypothetical protein